MIWYCECGCNDFCSFGKRFIKGHWARIHNPSKLSHVRILRSKNNPMKDPEFAKNHGLKRIGTKHPPSFFTKVKGISKSKEHRDKISKTKRDQHLKASAELKYKLSCIQKVIKSNPEFREKQRQRMLNGGAAYCNTFINNPSKPQIELFNLVKQIEIWPVLNFAVKELNICIDIAIPTKMIAIEYDGSYWHQDKEKDDKRQKQLEDLGWKFIRYRDIIPSLDELRNDIFRT